MKGRNYGLNTKAKLGNLHVQQVTLSSLKAVASLFSIYCNFPNKLYAYLFFLVNHEQIQDVAHQLKKLIHFLLSDCQDRVSTRCCV